MRKTFLVMSRLIDLFVDILPIDELGFKQIGRASCRERV